MDNTPRLDTLNGFGFPPLGEITDGLPVLDSLNWEYSGTRGGQTFPGPSQDSISRQGNAYLRRAFPRLDFYHDGACRQVLGAVTREKLDAPALIMERQANAYLQQSSFSGSPPVELESFVPVGNHPPSFTVRLNSCEVARNPRPVTYAYSTLDPPG